MLSDRDSIRDFFYACWDKFQQQQLLSPMEQQLVTIMQLHPEYHYFLNDRDKFQQENFATDTNPFLHMGLHMGLQEQLSTDRPSGINAIYAKLCARLGDDHKAQHQLMDIIAQVMWEAQQKGRWPEEQEYLEQLSSLR